MRNLRLGCAVAAGVAAAVVAGLVLVGGTANAATLFSDNFEDGNATGWATSGGSWAVTVDAARRGLQRRQRRRLVHAGRVG